MAAATMRVITLVPVLAAALTYMTWLAVPIVPTVGTVTVTPNVELAEFIFVVI